MLRQRINEALKAAMKGKNNRAVSTLRLILAAIKDRDISARAKGNHDGVGENELLSIFQSMIKQRRESIDLYQKAGRMELAQQESEEISIIETFLPSQLSEAELKKVIKEVIEETGAKGIKEMGKVMGVLKAKYAGRINFTKASQDVKAYLE